MPQRGVPYRPIVAVPQKIKELNPLFKMCQNMFFTALDPPRALVAATNLVPKITTTHSQVSSTPSTASRTPKPNRKDSESTSPTPPAPEPAQTLKPPQPQQTTRPGSKVGGEGPSNQSGPSSGYGGSPRKDADSLDVDSPNAIHSDPPRGPVSKPVSESSQNGDPKPGSEQLDSDPNIADEDPRPDVNPKSDPQSNTGIIEVPDEGTDSPRSKTSGIISEDSGQAVDTRPGSQSGKSGNRDGVAALKSGSGGHSGKNSGEAAAADSSDSKDRDRASNAAASSGDGEQGSETDHGRLLVIGNQNPGESTTINGQVAQPLSNNAISIAGTTLTPGGSPITVSRMRISLGQSAIAVGSSSVPILDVSPDPTPLRTELPQQSIFTIAGQIFTAAPAGFSLAGTWLPPSQAVTLAGTIVSLDTSSYLRIGSSTINLGENAVSLFPQVFTVAGQAITADPTAVNIAGVTLVPGGHGITVSGTGVSLDSAGELMVGSKILSVETSENLGRLVTEGSNSTRPSGTSLASSVGGIQPFEGIAKALHSSPSWMLMMLSMLAALLFQGFQPRIL